MRKLVYSREFKIHRNVQWIWVTKTNPTVMLQRNSWQIRQGVKYFTRDLMFGANSLPKYS